MIAVDQDDRELPAPIAEPIVEMWPLKAMLPVGISYETARRHAEAGTLRGAAKVGGRWFVSREDLRRWLASTGRL
jgi:predicted site-specific integrase-resolvase